MASSQTGMASCTCKSASATSRTDSGDATTCPSSVAVPTTRTANPPLQSAASDFRCSKGNDVRLKRWHAIAGARLVHLSGPMARISAFVRPPFFVSHHLVA